MAARGNVDCSLGICDTNGIGFGPVFPTNICSFDGRPNGRRLPLQQEIEEIREIVPDIEE